VTDAKPMAEMLRRAVAGEAAALEALLTRYRDYVRLVVRARCRGQLRQRVDNSDLVQETLMRAAQHIDEFRGQSEEEWRAWLGCIADREVIRQLRRHLGAERRALRREQGEPCRQDASSGQSRLEQWARTNSTPSAAAIGNERALQLVHALACLPDDYREVLELRHFEGLPFADIGQLLGRTAGAARVLWTRALKQLRDEILRENPHDRA